jgi:hypothetical protein
MVKIIPPWGWDNFKHPAQNPGIGQKLADFTFNVKLLTCAGRLPLGGPLATHSRLRKIGAPAGPGAVLYFCPQRL